MFQDTKIAFFAAHYRDFRDACDDHGDPLDRGSSIVTRSQFATKKGALMRPILCRADYRCTRHAINLWIKIALLKDRRFSA